VDAFLQEKIGFLDIARVISMAIEEHPYTAVDSLDQVLAADAWARQAAESAVDDIQGASYA
jgi:1-deoxy-D-xylulose-5-phosphate reductoisomerase